MQRATGLTISEWIRDKYNPLKQGPITEQFVAQEISARGELAAGELFYWSRNARGSSAEVDFLIPLRNGTIRVEVKSGTTGTLTKFANPLRRQSRDSLCYQNFKSGLLRRRGDSIDPTLRLSYLVKAGRAWSGISAVKKMGIIPDPSAASTAHLK